MATSTRRAAGDRWTADQAAIVAERGGRVTYFGNWEPDEFDAALARFDELASASGPVKSIAERQFDWVMAGHAVSVEEGMRRHGSIVAPGRACTTTSTSSPGSIGGRSRWVTAKPRPIACTT